MIEKLKIITEKYIRVNQNNPRELKKFELIKRILNTQDCFMNMTIEQAYGILRDLEIPENEIKNIYVQLI